ncbi:uncharacterized protein LOC131878799 isoform X2 [Tigriopus californicus]|nr:uncharacterized protein LOC131878799 isoform X2 [Tigriopus californicus]
MNRPKLNISSTGEVPMRENSQFAVIFPCTGKAEGEIDFLLQIKFTFSKGRTETLNFKRRKACLATKNSSTLSDVKDPGEVRKHHDLVPRTNEGTLPSSKGNTNNFDGHKGRVPPGSSTILLLGAVAGAVSLLSVLLTVMYVTRKKRIPQGPFVSSTINLRPNEEFPNYSKPTKDHRAKASTINGLLPPGQQYRLHRSRFGGSYATLASFTNVPVHAPIHVRSKHFYQDAVGSRGQNWRQFSPQWLEQYNQTNANNGPPPFSVWSSQTTSMSRPWRSGSQSTLLSHCQEFHNTQKAVTPLTTSTSTSGGGGGSAEGTESSGKPKHSQQNALVLENGMLRLCPQQPPTTQAQVEAKGDTTELCKDQEDANKITSVPRDTSPFYQNIPLPNLDERSYVNGGGAFLHRSHDSIYTDLLHQQDPYVMYTPQIYPHLMPQNFLQAQCRLPRSTSGGSVLV